MNEVNDRKMRVLLIAVYNDRMWQTVEELGISSIASFLRSKGHEVMLTSRHEDRVDFDRIVDFNPDIAGFSVYSISKQSVYQTISKLRRRLAHTLVCVGGILPTYCGREMMQECPVIDFAVKGEGELVFYHLLSALQQEKPPADIEGLIYRQGPAIIENGDHQFIADLNTLPFPARDMLVENGLQFAQVSTSRGCAARCSFCSSQLFWKGWRGRDEKNIVDEIEQVVNYHGVHIFNFIDSSFEDPGLNYKRVHNIVREILDRRLFISYFFNMRAEFHKKLDPRLMQLLKDSGLCGVVVGIESNNEFDRKLYNKKASLADNETFIALCREHGIVLTPGFINFNPYSTFENLRANIDFLEKHRLASNVELVYNRYEMYKYTALYQKIKNDSLLKSKGDGLFDYHFVDKRVGRLSDYVYRYMAGDGPVSRAFYMIKYYVSYYLILLAHYRRLFGHLGDEQARGLILGLEQNIERKCSEVNARVGQWFRRLLEMAERGWDEKAADAVTAELLGEGYVNESSGYILKVKNMAYQQLLTQNPRYRSYLFINLG
jgi:anaerobic magnesium-protoporphyrin IX monomethyl ester cyclase